MKIIDQVAVEIFCGQQIQGVLGSRNWKPEAVAENVRTLAEVLIDEAEDAELDEAEFKIATALLSASCGAYVIGGIATVGNFTSRVREVIATAKQCGCYLVEFEKASEESEPENDEPKGGETPKQPSETEGSNDGKTAEEDEEPKAIPTQRLADKGIPANIIDKLLSTNLSTIQAIVEYDTKTQQLDNLELIGEKIREKILDACNALLAEAE